MNKGNFLLSAMSIRLSTLAQLHPSAKTIRRDNFKALVELNTELVRYLHKEENPTPNWEHYPMARDWFTQNVRSMN